MNYNKKETKNISKLFKLISEKKFFLMLIFLNLVFQHYITYYVSANIDINAEKEQGEDANKYNTIIIVSSYILAIIFVLLLIFVPMSMMFKFLIFSLFSALYGIIFLSLSHNFDPNIIHGAGVGSVIIFVFMIFFGITMSGIRLSNKVAFGLFYSLMLLIIVSVVQHFIYNYLVITKLILIALASLFVLYIANTTNNILQRNYEGDFITASFDYYIDMSNIFNALKVDDA
jgi:FtsH-binding integral membrane protein